MTEPIRNFSQLDAELVRMGAFYARVAGICSVNARRRSDVRERAFLEHASREAARLAGALAQYRCLHGDAALRTWIQAVPDVVPPGEVELWELQSCGCKPSETLRQLHAATARWASLHARLGALAPTGHASEFHASVGQLLQAWCVRLHRAYVEMQHG